MSVILTTFLLSTLSLYTKKAVGGLFEKDSIIGEAAKETSVSLVKSAFDHFKNKFQSKDYQTPDNDELLRAVRMSFLNSALFICFARLKSFNMGKWNTFISQYLPQSEDASSLTKKFREQFLPGDPGERKEAEWLFVAGDKLEENRAKINDWKPSGDFKSAVEQIEIFLMPENESVKPFVAELKKYLSGKLIGELAEMTSFNVWVEPPPPKSTTPSAPESTNVSDRPVFVVQGVFDTSSTQEVLNFTTTQRLNNFHKTCLPPKLAHWIENGWQEIEPSQSEVTSLNLNGKTSSFDWFDVMCAFFAQELKQNQKVADIFQNKLLLDLKYRDSNDQECDLTIDVFRGELEKQNEVITARLKSIEDEVKNLNAGQTDIKTKVEKLLPMVATASDISQTVKSISQDVKVILENTTNTGKDVKQIKQEIGNLPDQVGEVVDRRLEIRLTQFFSDPSGKREEIFTLEQLRSNLEDIDVIVDGKFAELKAELRKGLKIIELMPSEDSSVKTEREKYLEYLGLIYFLDEKFKEAIKYHEDAIVWSELNLFVQKKIINLLHLGNAYIKDKEREKAMECYEKAIQILKQNPNLNN